MFVPLGQTFCPLNKVPVHKAYILDIQNKQKNVKPKHISVTTLTSTYNLIRNNNAGLKLKHCSTKYQYRTINCKHIQTD